VYSAGESTEWQCHVCTYISRASTLQCEMCSQTRTRDSMATASHPPSTETMSAEEQLTYALMLSQNTDTGQSTANRTLYSVPSTPPAPAPDSAQASAAAPRDYKVAYEDMVKSQECKICMDNQINTVLIPCGHRVACISCGSALDSCPMCRVLITGALQTYTP